MAYAAQSVNYGNLGERSLAMEFGEKAYQLRDRVTEREKLRIAANYFSSRGETEKAAQAYEMWIASYPRDFVPHGNLSGVYLNLGQMEKALADDFLRRATGHEATPHRETAFHRVYTCVRQRTHKK
jgi:eukaryotic-like serine/threonine-protein kinase